ncbi:MAG: hypothetical protein JWN00_2284, partial [Actinomycetia bacterium]|nr:hypothetical protein [Actinomycetes bacterium]
ELRTQRGASSRHPYDQRRRDHHHHHHDDGDHDDDYECGSHTRRIPGRTPTNHPIRPRISPGSTTDSATFLICSRVCRRVLTPTAEGRATWATWVQGLFAGCLLLDRGRTRQGDEGCGVAARSRVRALAMERGRDAVSHLRVQGAGGGPYGRSPVAGTCPRSGSGCGSTARRWTRSSPSEAPQARRCDHGACDGVPDVHPAAGQRGRGRGVPG